MFSELITGAGAKTGVQCTNKNTQTVGNTTTQTTLIPTSLTGNLNIAVNSVGAMYRLRIFGPFAGLATNGLTWTVKCGTTTLCNLLGSLANNSNASAVFSLEFDLTVTAVGKVSGSGQVFVTDTSGTALPVFQCPLGMAAALSVTPSGGVYALNVLATWNSQSVSNTLTANTVTLERLR